MVGKAEIVEEFGSLGNDYMDKVNYLVFFSLTSHTPPSADQCSLQLLQSSVLLIPSITALLHHC